jgi:hypothetical protein
MTLQNINKRPYAIFPQVDHVCESCVLVRYDVQPDLERYLAGREVMMSTIGSVMANKDCPSCRLVAQHVASIPDFNTIPKSKGLSLRLVNSSFSTRQPTSTSITPIRRPLYLEIHLCGTTSDHFTDGFNHVGALLQPVERAASYGSSFDQVANTTNLTSERNALVRLCRLPAFVDFDLLKEWMSFCSVSHE